jgi:uncharacterized protein (TIGR04255 family)
VEDLYYKENPLIQVAFQVRFNTILKIVQVVPSEFQSELIRLLHRKNIQYSLERSILINPEQGIQLNEPHVHVFTDAVRKVSIKLSPDYLQVVSSNYESFDLSFKKYVEASLEALRIAYDDQLYTRIGFMYQNLIIREKLGLSDWKEVLTEKSAPEIFEELPLGALNSFTKILNIVDGEYQYNCRTGLVEAQDRIDNGKYQGYIIDIDGFTLGEFEHESIFQHIETIRRSNKQLFRRFITDELHQKLSSVKV